MFCAWRAYIEKVYTRISNFCPVQLTHFRRVYNYTLRESKANCVRARVPILPAFGEQTRVAKLLFEFEHLMLIKHHFEQHCTPAKRVIRKLRRISFSIHNGSSNSNDDHKKHKRSTNFFPRYIHRFHHKREKNFKRRILYNHSTTIQQCCRRTHPSLIISY